MAARNLENIELVKKIEEEKRPATSEEQELLVQYAGFGASEIANKLAAMPAIRPEYGDADWRSLAQKAKELLTKEELRTLVKSTQYAHYTSEAVVRSMYRALERFGFRGGKILEPGAGVAQLLCSNQYIVGADFIKQKLPKTSSTWRSAPFQNDAVTADPE